MIGLKVPFGGSVGDKSGLADNLGSKSAIHDISDVGNTIANISSKVLDNPIAKYLTGGASSTINSVVQGGSSALNFLDRTFHKHNGIERRK
jgi:hypothetical protein